MTIPRTIAIDGPAGSGKSTLAEKLANYLGYLYFDTGVMYRAVTLAALETYHSVSDENSVTKLAEEIQIDVRHSIGKESQPYEVFLDGKNVTGKIRCVEIDRNVSQVSTYSGVRKAMTAQQRKIGLRGDVVMVGRDIGTVVVPEADLKIYLDASLDERARRRFDEIEKKGGGQSYAEIFASILRRDQIDTTRSVAPLRPAEDAIRIDSDGLNIEQVLDRVKSYLDLPRKIANASNSHPG
jgi:cytidylate kinase